MLAREFLQRNSDNLAKLKEFAELILPFYKKIFFYKQDSLEFFKQDYSWMHQDYQNATHLELSMEEIIDNDRYLIELNGTERFFTFTYGEYGT